VLCSMTSGAICKPGAGPRPVRGASTPSPSRRPKPCCAGRGAASAHAAGMVVLCCAGLLRGRVPPACPAACYVACMQTGPTSRVPGMRGGPAAAIKPASNGVTSPWQLLVLSAGAAGRVT
jgi:hypothetical protein